MSETNENKIEYLFLLEQLFKKSELTNVYSKFLSEKIKEIGVENLPKDYQEAALSRIVTEEVALGKVKYNDKILHKSKIMKYFIEDENKKKIQRYR